MQLVYSYILYNFSDMFEFRRICEYHSPAGWRGLSGRVEDHLIITVLKGSMQAIVDQGDQISIQTGAFLSLPEGTHRYVFCDVETVSMRLRYKGQSRLIQHGVAAPSALQILHNMHQFHAYPQLNPQTMSLLLDAFLAELEQPSLSPLRNQGQDRSQAFALWLQQALQGESNINDGARQFGLSPDHFSRLFKQQYGQTPKAYIMEHRFQKAVTILLEEQISTADLARRVGISDSALFCKQFKQRFGCSPGSYRSN